MRGRVCEESVGGRECGWESVGVREWYIWGSFSCNVSQQNMTRHTGEPLYVVRTPHGTDAPVYRCGSPYLCSSRTTVDRG